MLTAAVLAFLPTVLFAQSTDWKIVEGLEINPFSKEKIQVTEKELKDEKAAVEGLI